MTTLGLLPIEYVHLCTVERLRVLNLINTAPCVHYIEQKDCTAVLHAGDMWEIPYTKVNQRWDFWTVHVVEELSRINSSPARAAGQVWWERLNYSRLNSSEFKNLASGRLQLHRPDSKCMGGPLDGCTYSMYITSLL